jgi:hypothetical protein
VELGGGGHTTALGQRNEVVEQLKVRAEHAPSCLGPVKPANLITTARPIGRV